MALWGNRDQLSDAPKFVVDSATGKTGTQQYGNTVFLADAAEVAAQKAVPGPGWVKRTVGTGGRSGRITYEILAAIGGTINTDATDFANNSTANVANSTGTVDDTVLPDA
jgi:hypothetical protein